MKTVTLREAWLKIKDSKQYVIVGAGPAGRKVLAYFGKYDLRPICYFDNNGQLSGELVDGILVKKPCMLDEDTLYFICVRKEEVKTVLYEQLLSLGINEESIFVVRSCMPNYSYEYLSNMPEERYQEELDLIYLESFGRFIDWEHPKTYNEIINWEKLNVRDPRRTKYADKYQVREWIQEQIGEEYLVKYLGVWDRAEEIDFSVLPNQFVLKLNNGSSRNIVVKDKSIINEEEIRTQLDEWMNKNFAFVSYEMHYKDIPPKIICEEYLEGLADVYYDYNVFCFHGEPKYIWCINGSHKEDCKASFYDLNWEKQPFYYGYPMDEELAPKPEKLDEMLDLCRILAKDFEHVRVDWYEYPNCEKGILFGEMTFSTWGGIVRIEPEEYDKLLGELIKDKRS